MLAINSSNKYFEFYELIHQVKLTKEDRATPLFYTKLRVNWNVSFEVQHRRRASCHFPDIPAMHKTYEEKIEQLKPFIDKAKTNELYLKLCKSKDVKNNTNAYIHSLLTPEQKETYLDGEFIEYLNILFLADISFFLGLYLNELETENENEFAHREIRDDYKYKLKNYFIHLHNLIILEANPNYNYGSSAYMSTLMEQRSIIIHKLCQLQIVHNTKNNYPERMLIGRLSNYIWSNYGLNRINEIYLISSLISSEGVGGSNSLSNDTIEDMIAKIRNSRGYFYKRVPRKIRRTDFRNYMSPEYLFKMAKAKRIVEAKKNAKDAKYAKHAKAVDSGDWNLLDAKTILKHLKL